MGSKAVFEICFTALPQEFTTTELLCTDSLKIVKRMCLVAASSRWSWCVNLADRQEPPTGVGPQWFAVEALSPGTNFLNTVETVTEKRACKEKESFHWSPHWLDSLGLWSIWDTTEQWTKWHIIMDPWEGSLFLLAKQEGSEVSMHLAKANSKSTFSAFHHKGSWGSL